MPGNFPRAKNIYFENAVTASARRLLSSYPAGSVREGRGVGMDKQGPVKNLRSSQQKVQSMPQYWYISKNTEKMVQATFTVGNFPQQDLFYWHLATLWKI
jgi:hypothetical protein